MDRQFVYIILAVAVLLFIGMMIKDWRFSSSKKEKQKQANDPSSGQSGLAITLPLCLQAYERLVVFLERIRPEALVGRLAQPQPAMQVTRQLLIQSIRSEYEHNVSQQVYVSAAAWEAVESAKEQSIHLINTIASQLPADADGHQFAKALLNQSSRQAESPVSIALNVLNSESKKLMETTKFL